MTSNIIIGCICIISAVTLGIFYLKSIQTLDDRNNVLHKNTINIARRDDETARYVESVLWLAIGNTDFDKGIKMLSQEINAPEWRDALEQKKVDVIWSSPTPDLEDRFLKIPIDLYDNMMGLRVCVTNANSEKEVKKINTLEDLKRFKLGSGRGWADTIKLKDAELNVVVDDLDNLIRLVGRGELDCLLRGIFEPWDEEKSYIEKAVIPLLVNETFVIKYRNPFYLWVHRDNKRLYTMIREGLNRAIAKGDFGKNFKQSRQYQQYQQHGKLNQRTVIEIE